MPLTELILVVCIVQRVDLGKTVCAIMFSSRRNPKGNDDGRGARGLSIGGAGKLYALYVLAGALVGMSRSVAGQCAEVMAVGSDHGSVAGWREALFTWSKRYLR